MKKGVLYFGFLCVTVSLLTGCGTETLRCTKKDESNEDLKMTQEVVATFKKGKVATLDTTTKVELSGIYKDHQSSFENSLESQFSQYKGKKGISIKTSTKGDTVTLSMKVDLNKMDSSTKTDLGLLNTYGSKEESKKNLEADGYTCK